jgi:hypothetical protein
MPAQGPMALEARRAYEKQRTVSAKEYEIEMDALKKQGLPPDQFRRKAAALRGKHALKANQMKTDWDERMTKIQQYEKLGSTGTIPPEEALRSQLALSGYSIAKQTQKHPDLWAEHRNLIAERERLEQMNDPWDRRKGKGTYRRVLELHTKGKKKGQPKKWGEVATAQELEQIQMIRDRISELDQYEYDLMRRMDPQSRKVNQLSRAMSMGPPVPRTPGVGGKQDGVPLGEVKRGSNFVFPGGYLTPAVKAEPERLSTGKDMTRADAIRQAQGQLGGSASRERVMALAKQIYGNR